jgi:hypothetical protein
VHNRSPATGGRQAAQTRRYILPAHAFN